VATKFLSDFFAESKIPRTLFSVSLLSFVGKLWVFIMRDCSMSKWVSGSSTNVSTIANYEDFEPGSFEFEGVRRGVYKSGEGPGIIVIHEIPGLYDKVLDFARKLNNAGYTTYLPSLIGTPGKPLTASYGLSSMAKLCVSREFNRVAHRKEAPLANWLRALARDCHARCGGPGVGAIGMCFSGGFALAMMADESVIAPVLSQPSMPFGLTKKLKADVDMNLADLPKIREHMENHDICLLALKFSHDSLVPTERFDYLKNILGDRFVGVEIDSSPGNSHAIKSTAHSVLASDFVDDEDHPTYKAYEKVIALFEKQLKKKSGSI